MEFMYWIKKKSENRYFNPSVNRIFKRLSFFKYEEGSVTRFNERTNSNLFWRGGGEKKISYLNNFLITSLVK